MRRLKSSRSAAAAILALITTLAHAGGPRFVAGTSYFDPGLAGQPILWPGGRVAYFVDQGSLSPTVNNATATATVSAAASVWNAVPTAAILVTQGGSLAEDVSGANVRATSTGLVLPADIRSAAAATPVAVVFDADGSVIDALYGADASNPDDCINFGVLTIVDNLTASGHIAHALMIVNGLCAQSAIQLQQIQFQLTRAFGRVLGLDWSQANDSILFGPGTPSPWQLQGWPLMRPIDVNCNQLSITCMPNPFQLRADDTAALSRLYPVTFSNQTHAGGKTPTAPATLSVHGTITFRRGEGMQGVNVVARPLTPGSALPDDRFPTSAVSGFQFTGDRGNQVTGITDAEGYTLPRYGSTDVLLQGSYDLTGISLPPGQTQADYQLTLEPVNPLYTGEESVGPYTLGSPTPSGTMPVITLRGLSAGMSVEQDFVIQDSASDEQPGSGGTAATPATLPVTGEWQSRIANAGQSAWFGIPLKGGQHVTFEAQALNEDGTPSENELRSVLGLWNPLDAASSLPVLSTIAPFNGAGIAVTSLALDTIADGELLLGIADQRGDGRPDYVFHGRVLSANSVSPQHLPPSGGPITINGSGFRPGMVVSIGNILQANVLEVTPTVILAMAPPSAGSSGSLDLIITDPQTNGVAALAGGISYGDGSADTMSVVTAPPSSTAAFVATPFTVRVFGPDQITPVSGVPVLFSTLQGSITFSACKSPHCAITTTGDGYATALVTANQPGLNRIQASLATGSLVDAEFTAVSPPILNIVTPPLFLAPYATWSWTVQVLAINGPTPEPGIAISWSGQAGNLTVASSSATNSSGLAAISLTLGPWPPGTSLALTACTPATDCASTAVFVVHPETEALSAVSDTQQQLAQTQSPAPVTVRLRALAGQPIAGGAVTFTGLITAWSPPCAPATPCPLGRLLSSFSQSTISAADGSASFQPISIPGIPQVITGMASAGSSASIPFVLEVHP